MTDTLAPRTVPSGIQRGRRKPVLIAVSLIAGALLAWLWSFTFVDQVVGDNIADSLLGQHAKTADISTPLTGVIFSMIAGLAGTLTACNVAVFAAVGPLVEGSGTAGRGRRAWSGAALLTGSAVAVSAAYGLLATLVSAQLPQLSTQTYLGMPGRIFQAMVVYLVIGAVMLGLALVHAGLLGEDRRSGLVMRPRVQLVVLGALFGALVVGRPFPLFEKVLSYAVDHDLPLYTALVTAGTTLANMIVALALTGLLMVALPGRARVWLADHSTGVTVGGLAVFGAFLIVYWGMRVPAMFGVGWFPAHPFT